MKRQTTLAVCRNVDQTNAKSGKTRTRENIGGGRESPANWPDSALKAARLKIVVSPVRVRVSPLPEVPAHVLVFASVEAGRSRRIWAQEGVKTPILCLNCRESPGTEAHVPRCERRFPLIGLRPADLRMHRRGLHPPRLPHRGGTRSGA